MLQVGAEDAGEVLLQMLKPLISNMKWELEKSFYLPKKRCIVSEPSVGNLIRDA
jgi:hypothetical protein